MVDSVQEGLELRAVTVVLLSCVWAVPGSKLGRDVSV